MAGWENIMGCFGIGMHTGVLLEAPTQCISKMTEFQRTTGWCWTNVKQGVTVVSAPVNVHPVPIKIKVVNPLAKPVYRAPTKTKLDNPLSKPVPKGNTQTKVGKPLAKPVIRRKNQF
tara:strand:- start:1036 stop:1386 length:351 start_codon:yes stop_codon:yes gene_type:complete